MSGQPARGLAASIRRMLRNRFYVCYGMRGTAPVNPAFGREAGTPIDRYYIGRYLAEERARITGDILEIGDRSYSREYGTGVRRSDVLSAAEGAEVTFVGDLAHTPEIADASYDCVVLVQTLHYLPDMRAGLAEVHRVLKPGGAVLCTVPGISQVSRYDMERWGDRWRLTSLGAEELFATTFALEDVAVTTYGNALSSACFLYGIPAERVSRTKLDRREEDYQLVVCVTALKSREPEGRIG